MGRSYSADNLSFLTTQRWFAGKARTVAQIETIATAPLTADATATLVRVAYSDGGEETYFVPMVFSADGFKDGLSDPHVCLRLLDLIERNEQIAASPEGSFRGVQSMLFSELRGDPKAPIPVRPAAHDQSNSAVLFGDRLFLKIFRKVEPGANPDYEIAKFLTERTAFTRLPRLAGVIEFRPAAGPAVTLATLQELVPNEGDAWTATLQAVRASLQSAKPPAVGSADLLGRRTAELHLALSSNTNDDAFSPQPMTKDDCEALAARLRRTADSVFQTLRNSTTEFEPSIARQVGDLLARGPQLVENFAGLLAVEPMCVKMRIHGDYHLGQVLCQGQDFIILDFEGEPARSLAERRAKDSPLRDVAGMLRSFGYAAYAALFELTTNNPQDLNRLEPRAKDWQRQASAAFLKGYFATAGGAPFLPDDETKLAALLDFFIVEKALYEVLYELNNRPAWLRIPLAGILSLA